MNSKIIKIAAVIASVAALSACNSSDKFLPAEYGSCTGAIGAAVMANQPIGQNFKAWFFNDSHGQAQFAKINNKITDKIGVNYTEEQVIDFIEGGGLTKDEAVYFFSFNEVYYGAKQMSKFDRESNIIARCGDIIGK